MAAKHNLPRMKRCRVCGCTEQNACYPPCEWDEAEPEICSTCADLLVTMADWSYSVPRANMAALMREYRRLIFDCPIPFVLVEGPEALR